ncbi:MAG TPA: bifunctional DNA primase/polymerase, partial [Candidatus Acidoferrum sp.]|nr:bifunctional DNA primase/polymerase [Candidatus Acidoferrum sp.]
MLDFALQYAAHGWPVFQVSGHKVPFKGSHGHLDATTDQAVITGWFQKRPKANIALATGAIIVLDLDGSKAFESPRGRELGALAQAHGGLPRTLTARTARGVHLYYACPPGVTIRSSNERREGAGADGVDLKGNGGFVVLPPSVNARSQFQYEWLHNIQLAVMPDWLVKWAQELGGVSQSNVSLQSLGAKPDYLKQTQSTTAKSTKAALGVEYNARELQRILSALKAVPADHYDTWIEIGMALHSLDWERSDGTSVAFDIWDRWSATCAPKYHPVGMAEKWASFGRTGRTEISIATLFHHASRHGWQPPAPPAVNVEQEARPQAPQQTASPQPQSPAAGGHLNGHQLPAALTAPSGSESPLIKLNENYAVIGDIGGRCLVMGWVQSKVDDTVFVPSFQTFKSFAERHAHQYVMATKPKGDEWVHEPQQLGTAWLKWGRRRTYDGLDMVPNGPEVLPNNHLNLWRGMAVQPMQGPWPLMKYHIAKVLARANEAALDYIIKWAAWKLQHPGECPQVALVFKGSKGAGKGTFARTLRQFFGAHGLQVFNSKHLVGQFNAHLRNCLLLYADEAFWAGDKQGESTLKGLITEPTIPIEQKGVDLIDWKNRIGLI